MTLAVHRDDSDELRHHVQKYHYLHRWPDPRSLPFGYALAVEGTRYAPDGRLWGLVVMKKPQHHRHAGLFGYPDLPTEWQVLDLARVWVNPSLQGLGYFGLDRAGEPARHTLAIFSQMVSRVLHRVQRDWLAHHPPVYPELPYHIRLIISYCEVAHHDGTAYRASGFTSFGATGDGTKEIYVRKLRQPLKAWTASAPVQAAMAAFVYNGR
jgi:hypothetical protein